jgi:SAM-dependent methyltransferase
MKTGIDYDFSRNSHTLRSPKAAVPILFSERMPKSLIDVGCGTGTWLRAAMDLGISDVFGLDGINVSPIQLLIPRALFQQQDLTLAWNLKRRFDVAFCLEVAEHLDSASAFHLIKCITEHADLVYFSAAPPGQTGQHHVNCQWPDYWQSLFNSCGYVCSDQVRWRIWDDTDVDPWYRQNLFEARSDPAGAGKETRIKRVIHPELFEQSAPFSWSRFKRRAEQGVLPTKWYMTTPLKAVLFKIRRRIKRAVSPHGQSQRNPRIKQCTER